MNFIKKLLFFLLIVPCLSQAQVITTVAGNGTQSFCGDGGPATAGCLYWPSDIVADKHGNIYFSESVNSVIRKVDTVGIISTIAGLGFNSGYNGDSIAATDAQLYSPYGIALDRSGSLYIADLTNQRIRKIDTAGIITTIAGTGTAGYNGDGIAATAAQLRYPNDVEVDSAGNIYIADLGGHRIRKINAAGIISTIAGTGTAGFSGVGGPATGAHITPGSVTLDKYDNVYFADSANCILKINSAGIMTTIAGNGTNIYSGDGGPATSAGLRGVAYIAIDDTGNIYLPDQFSRVRKINTSGIISRIAGIDTLGFSGDGGSPLFAKLRSPVGVAISSTGKIYIAEQDNNRIRCIDYSKSAGVAEVKNNNAFFSIFPNPANKGCFSLTVNSLRKEIVAVKISNVLGVVVQELTCNTNIVIPVILDVPNGLYYLQTITAAGNFTEKIIVQ